MTAARWAIPQPEWHASKLDDAIDRGFDPGERPHPTPAWVEAEFQASGYDSALDWFAASVEAARESTPPTCCNGEDSSPCCPGPTGTREQSEAQYETQPRQCGRPGHHNRHTSATGHTCEGTS